MYQFWKFVHILCSMWYTVCYFFESYTFLYAFICRLWLRITINEVYLWLFEFSGPESFEVDEHPKPQTTLEGLAKLPAIFKKGGTVSAGNASVRKLALNLTSMNIIISNFLHEIWMKFVALFVTGCVWRCCCCGGC